MVIYNYNIMVKINKGPNGKIIYITYEPFSKVLMYIIRIPAGVTFGRSEIINATNINKSTWDNRIKNFFKEKGFIHKHKKHKCRFLVNHEKINNYLLDKFIPYSNNKIKKKGFWKKTVKELNKTFRKGYLIIGIDISNLTKKEKKYMGFPTNINEISTDDYEWIYRPNIPRTKKAKLIMNKFRSLQRKNIKLRTFSRVKDLWKINRDVTFIDERKELSLAQCDSFIKKINDIVNNKVLINHLNIVSDIFDFIIGGLQNEWISNLPQSKNDELIGYNFTIDTALSLNNWEREMDGLKTLK